MADAPECIPPLSDADYEFGPSLVVDTYPEHRWTWGMDLPGRYFARCLRCGMQMRFAREEGDRFNQETLTTFYRSAWQAQSHPTAR